MEEPTLNWPTADNQLGTDQNVPPEEYSKEQIVLLLQAHASCTGELRAQLEEYRQAHSGLRMQLDRLAGDTQRLVAAASSEAEAPRQQRNLSDNLRSRLKISEQERETAMELWRLAQTELQAVEMELRASQDGSQLHQVRRESAAATSALEQRLTAMAGDHERQRLANAKLSSELSTAREQLSTALGHVKQRDEELQAGLEANKQVAATMRELEAVVRRQQAALAKFHKDSSALESALAASRAHALCWERREAETREKLAEALAITDAALVERDCALAERDKAQKEMSRLSAAWSELMSDAGAAVHAEVTRVAREHAEKMAAVTERLHQAEKREAEAVAAAAAEKTRLTAELDSMRRPTSPVERKLHAAYRELTAAERKHMAVREELHRLRHSTAQLQEELQAVTSAQQMCGVKCDAERTELRSRLVDTTLRADELSGHLEHQRELQRKWSVTAQTLTVSFESHLRHLHSKLRAEKKKRGKVLEVHNDEDQSTHSLSRLKADGKTLRRLSVA